MPILLNYAPIGPGAQIAQNTAAEKERQIREQERMRRQQAYEQQRQFEEEMARHNRQDFINNLFHSRAQDLEQGRLDQSSDYHNDQLDLNRQRLQQADTPAEKWRRLKEQLVAKGELQGAQIAAQNERQARQLDYNQGRDQSMEQGRNERFGQGLDQRATQFDSTMEYKKARDAEHDQLMRDLAEQKMAALQRAATARDDSTRHKELTTAADLDVRAAVHQTDRHFRAKPKPDAITGQIDQAAMAQWTSEHRQLIEQEAAAQQAARQIRSAAAPTSSQGGPNMQNRRDTPQAFQNDPLQEGPAIGAGAPPSMPQGVNGDAGGEFGRVYVNPQTGQMIQWNGSQWVGVQ